MDNPSVALAAPQPVRLEHRQIVSILGGILLAMFLAALDQTIIATALPTIGRDLGDLEHLPWVVTTYLVTSTAVTPLYGKLSDIHGRRIVLLTGIVIFLAGSVACALAPTMTALILGRALQGLGGGGLIALAQTIIGDMVSPRERGRYQAYFAGVFTMSSLLGPVLGGVIAEHLHWSYIFWINLPLGLLAYLLSSRSLKLLPRYERRHRVDYLGALLLVAATTSVLLALNWGGVRYPWASPPILGLILASAALWTLFGWRLRRAPEPLIPTGVFRNPVVRVASLAAGFGMGTYIGLTIYVPVYFETVRGLSASASGLALIPLMVGTVTGATISGRVMMKVRHYKRLPVAGLLVAAVCAAILAAFAGSLPIWALEIVLAVLSIGMGTLLPVTTVSVQNAVEPHELGTATGAINFSRSLGAAFIVAGFGAIVLGGSGLAGRVASFEALAMEAARTGVSLETVFRLLFAASVAGFLLAFAFLTRMEERPLRGHAPAAAE